MAISMSTNPDFKASKGWYERFVKRNNYLQLKEAQPNQRKYTRSKKIDIAMLENETKKLKSLYEHQKTGFNFASQKKQNIIIPTQMKMEQK